ncbi:MAG: hypothetical protein HWE10_05370 [Gammaproteobacteria bacterium]|nr:hypothetical protein [Gammaproteobacteria bacterium]
MLACSSAKQEGLDAQKRSSNVEIWPKLDIQVAQSAAVEAKMEALLADMTLQQKVAQMIQPEIRDITVEEMRQYGFGSYLNGGGAFPNNNKHATPDDWVQLAEDMYQASVDSSLDGSSIPTMWGTDAVHGHNNIVGATLSPHNIGLGAANNAELLQCLAPFIDSAEELNIELASSGEYSVAVANMQITNEVTNIQLKCE